MSNNAQETWDTGDIARFLGLQRRYVTDEVTKQPDFPEPVINRTQRMRRWAAAKVQQWAKGKR